MTHTPRLAGLAAALAALVLAPQAARAQSDFSIHATGTTSNGWTSNVDNSGNDDDPATPEPQSGLFGTAQPGALLTFTSPRTTQQVIYDLTYTYFPTQEGGDSLLHRLAWVGQFQTSPRTGLNLGAEMTLGQTNPVIAEAELQQPGFTPPGQTDVATVALGESFEFQLSPAWRLSQNSNINFASTEPADGNQETTARTFALGVGVDRTFQFDSIGLQLTGTFIQLRTIVPGNEMLNLESDQLNLTAEAVWNHELAPRWGSTLAAGVTRTSSPDDQFDPVTRPSGRAAVVYTPDWGMLRVEYARAVAVDLFLGQNTLSDIVTFSAFRPVWEFDESVILAGATAGYGRFRAVDAEFGETQSEFDAVNTGLSATWRPIEEPYGVTMGYVYVRQDAEQDVPRPLTTFDRHTVMITVFGRYPYRRAGQLTELDQQRAAREGRQLDSNRVNTRQRTN